MDEFHSGDFAVFSGMLAFEYSFAVLGFPDALAVNDIPAFIDLFDPGCTRIKRVAILLRRIYYPIIIYLLIVLFVPFRYLFVDVSRSSIAIALRYG